MLTIEQIKKVGRMMQQTQSVPDPGPALCTKRPKPRAMVLVYEPLLTHSVWEDFSSQHRTRRGLIARLRRGVRKGEWVGWRLMHVEHECLGNISAENAERLAGDT